MNAGLAEGEITQELLAAQGNPVNIGGYYFPDDDLAQVVSFIKRISISDLAASQFSDLVIRPDGSAVRKPTSWA